MVDLVANGAAIAKTDPSPHQFNAAAKGQLASSRIACLDGFRGIASLWVLLGHAMMLTGWYVPVIGDPALGVDLFMMMSGFLMVFHYQMRSRKVSPDAPGEWRTFWIRRYFRIAPLYYAALILALLLGGMLYESRTIIDTFLHAVAQRPERYLDHSATNVVLHVSFLFGLLPDYGFRTPLPDWSLTLEMQFYAAFPLLMLLLRRAGWIGGMAMMVGGAGVLALLLNRLGVLYEMPTALPFKLHVFACGMLLAAAVADRRRAFAHLVISMVLVALPIGAEPGLRQLVVREALVLGTYGLVLHDSLGPLRDLAGWISRSLGNKLFHWLGELSFGVYLLHLIVMQPAGAGLIVAFGPTISAPVRFLLVLLIVVPVTYACAFITYRLAEGPGQRLGAWLVRFLFGRSAPARPDAAESIAAP